MPGTRVNLRTALPSDIPDYERWNDPGLKVWDYDGPWYSSRGTSPTRVRDWLAGDHNPPYSHLEIETIDGVHIGWAMVHYRENDPHMPEVGLDIVEDAYWNRGLGTEALSLWVDYLFQERRFTRIGYSTWSGNPRAIAIGRKLGFVEEGRIRKGCQVGGVFYDRIKMGLLREEWEEAKRRSTA